MIVVMKMVKRMVVTEKMKIMERMVLIKIMKMMEKVVVVEKIKVRRMVMVEKMKTMERMVTMIKVVVFYWYSLCTRNDPYIDDLIQNSLCQCDPFWGYGDLVWRL